MHPIIDKLKDQALIVDTTFSDTPFVVFNQDKFAYLIIQECVNFLHNDLNAPDFAKKVAEHFDID